MSIKNPQTRIGLRILNNTKLFINFYLARTVQVQNDFSPILWQ